VTGDATIEVYRMDGQGGVIRTLTEFSIYSMKSLVVEQGSNHLYFELDNHNDEPQFLSRIQHNFTDLHKIIDFNQFKLRYPLPASPFALHEFIYLQLGGNGISTFSKTGTILCFDLHNRGPYHSGKILHYDRQPGK